MTTQPSTARTVVSAVAATVLLAIGLAVFWWLALVPAPAQACEAGPPSRPGCFPELRSPVAIGYSSLLAVLYLGVLALTMFGRALGLRLLLTLGMVAAIFVGTWAIFQAA